MRITRKGAAAAVAALVAACGVGDLLSQWSTPEYLSPSGSCPTGTATWTAACRWMREWKVTNLGVGNPYDISVRVTYNLDGATPKVLRLDMERRKTF